MIALRSAERTVERWTEQLTNLAHVAGRKPGAQAGFGVLFLALVAVIITLVLMSFGGAFATYDTVQAQLPEQGSSVALNSPVEYRDVTVGKVATTPVGNLAGQVKVVLHLKPSMMGSIPSNVTATVAPISIFGNQYVVLEPPSGRPVGSLRNGQSVPPITEGPTASVQNTLANLDYLLTQLHPAQLYTALSALADSIQGQGYSLGQTFDRFSTYLGQMQPLWPKVVADLNLLVPVSNQLTVDTPAILGILSNFSTTSGTITGSAMAVDQLFSGGTDFANLTTALLADIQQPYSELAASAGPFLSSLAQTPETISEILQGLNGWAKTWVAAEANGPYLSLTANVNVTNVADLALVALGGSNISGLLAGALGSSLVNPATYTSADCPSYGDLIGQGCGAAEAAANKDLKSVSILPQPAETNAAATIAGGLNGGVAPTSPSVSSLLLGPLLTSLVSK
jgi:virulence factor Mce-like protein